MAETDNEFESIFISKSDQISDQTKDLPLVWQHLKVNHNPQPAFASMRVTVILFPV